MHKKNLTICFFGRYDPNYSRNRILKRGLEQNGVKIIECRTELKRVVKYFDLIKKHWKIRKEYDVLLVAFPGWHAMILSKFLTRKPIIFDIFLSVYDSTVFDRKNTEPNSIKARYFWFLDWLACKLADKVLLDTNEHIKYFVQEFGIEKEKFARVLVGTDERVFSPIENLKNNGKFTIHFHGTNISLQGIKYILESAKLLEKYPDIQFNIIGTNIKREYQNNEYKNINFTDNVPYKKLPMQIAQTDVCLGIFGDTDKVQRVIPNKVYECIACHKPVITADTSAIRELFDESDLMLIPTANSQELVKAILKLKKDVELREKLVENAYNKFIKNCTPKIITLKLLKEINV
ncbi:MAG: glycosyltransferase [Candidatus Pacebacteria bacterium]|nr:glycosyltransferase [Candidatus Paceibacterota bacterium]